MKLKLWRSLLLGLCLSNAIAPHVASQVIPDGTTNSIVNTTNNSTTIDAGSQSGTNLFHSFEQFDLLNGNEAFFNNANDIVNIFSRVTGGNISEVEGLIRANGNANLFLINPAGIIFGEGAALDIGGSFTASTADSIIFSDDVEFSATPGNESLLTINQPIGLNYGNNPGNIAVDNSNLRVDNRKSLALLGGDVTITGGQIIAPGANIELGGLSEAGQVNFIRLEETNVSSTSFPEGVARGDLTLSNDTNVDVQAAGDGNIKVNARNLELSRSNLQAGIGANFQLTATKAGDITLNAAEIISIDDGTIANEVQEQGTGNGGDIELTRRSLFLNTGSGGNINISTQSLFLDEGASIDATNQGIGGADNTGGNINLQISDLLTLQDNSTISAEALGNANGGNIRIDADFIIAQPNQNNDIIAAAAGGTGGNISVTTNAIFGLEESRFIPSNDTNDLDASSILGIDSTIDETNPIQALEVLPIEVIDVTSLVEQNLCQQGQGSEFVVTGKGGTAPSPTQARDGSVSQVDLVKPVPFSEVEAATQEAQKGKEESSEIVEAQGWVVNDRGMVELVASKTDVDTPTQLKSIRVCHQ